MLVLSPGWNIYLHYMDGNWHRVLLYIFWQCYFVHEKKMIDDGFGDIKDISKMGMEKEEGIVGLIPWVEHLPSLRVN